MKKERKGRKKEKREKYSPRRYTSDAYRLRLMIRKKREKEGVLSIKIWIKAQLLFFISLNDSILRFVWFLSLMTHQSSPAQSAGVVKYTKCIPTEGKPHSHNECPRYDIKPSDGEAATLEIWTMWSTPSLPFLPGLLLPE